MELGGGGTLGIQLSRALGIQVTNGTIFAKSGNEQGSLWRARMTYAFSTSIETVDARAAREGAGRRKKEEDRK